MSRLRAATVLTGTVGLLLLVVGLARAATAADAALVRAGERAFADHCAACHGTTVVAQQMHLPGTEALLIKYHGKVPGALEQRTDLTAAYIRFVVRHGVSVTPFFRKTMVSDVELDAIAAYLTRNNPPAGPR